MANRDKATATLKSLIAIRDDFDKFDDFLAVAADNRAAGCFVGAFPRDVSDLFR